MVSWSVTLLLLLPSAEHLNTGKYSSTSPPRLVFQAHARPPTRISTSMSIISTGFRKALVLLNLLQYKSNDNYFGVRLWWSSC
jgi:hypothetical protein